MMDAGIPDPAKLMRLAQQYAASVAGMLLTTLANNPSGNRRVFFLSRMYAQGPIARQ